MPTRFIGILLPFFVASLAHAQTDAHHCEAQPLTQPVVGCRYTPEQSSPWTEPDEIEWSRDIRGQRSGIVNIYVHGELADLTAALTHSGWTQSLDRNHANNSAYAKAAAKFELDRLRGQLRKKKEKADSVVQSEDQLNDQIDKTVDLIQSMPVSDETVCGKTQVAAFESDNNPLGGRHHLRIFATGRQDSHGLSVWAVVANRDTGIMFDRHRANQGFLNHRIEANADFERDKVLVDLMIRNEITGSPSFKHLSLNCPPPADKAVSEDNIAVEVEIHR